MPDLIPIEAAKNNHTVGVVLSGSRYFFVKKWNSEDAAWYLDILNEDKSSIADGVKVVLGVNLGRRSPHQFFQEHVLCAEDTSGTDLDAGYDDFGTRVILLHYGVDELKGRTS